MTSLQTIPLEILREILENISGHRNGDLLNAACACKTFKSVALDILYRDIVIDSQCKGLLPLAYCLLKAPSLAERARSLTLHAFPPEIEPVINWTPPADFPQLYHQWLTARKYSDEWIHVWKRELDQQRPDYLFAMVAQMCQKISDMKFPTVLGIHDFSYCPLFPQHEWVWNSLKDLYATVHYSPGYQEIGCAVLEQLMQSPLTTTAVLNCLRYDGINVNDWLSVGVEHTQLLRIRSISFENAKDWPYLDRQWHSVTSVIEHSSALEDFRLHIKTLRVDRAVFNVPKLIRALKRHTESLYIIDLQFDRADSWTRYREGLPEQIQIARELQSTDYVVDFHDFDNLQYLYIDLFLLFGSLPFEEVYRPSGTTDEISLEEAWRYVLVERLPSSLRTLGLACHGLGDSPPFLTEVIPGLLEHRVGRFPFLRSFIFLDFSDESFPALFSTPEVIAAKASGVMFQFKARP